MDDPNVKVVFVAGCGRSGSTLLGNILGEVDRCFHAGELRDVWRAGSSRGRWCGCGRPARECPIWSEVLAASLADPGMPAQDAGQVADWQRRTMRIRYTPRLLRAARRGWLQPPLDSYLLSTGILYRSVARATGSDVIVDTSKKFQMAAVLAAVPGIEPYWVHLVRDPRAYAYSCQRIKAVPHIARKRLPRIGPIASGRNWMTLNLGTELVRRSNDPARSILIRYEDLAARPRDVVERVAGMVGMTPGALPFVDDTTVSLGPNHTLAGNPNRFESGLVRLRADDEWLSGQRRIHRLAVTAVTMPLLGHYRYPLWPIHLRHSPAPTVRG